MDMGVGLVPVPVALVALVLRPGLMCSFLVCPPLSVALVIKFNVPFGGI